MLDRHQRGNPFSYIAYFNYGVILSELGDRLGAIKTFRECLQVNPDFIPAHINLGRALEDFGRPGGYLAEWGKATAKLAPITGDKIAHKCTLLIQSGRLLDSLHQSAAAEDALREAFETDPSQSEAILQWINLRQRQMPLARGCRIGTCLAGVASCLDLAFVAGRAHR